MRFILVSSLLFASVAGAQTPFGGTTTPAVADDTTPAAPKRPRAKSITVVLPGSKEHALDIVTAALLQGGYQIDQTGPSFIRTVPLEKYGSTAGLVMRATVVGGPNDSTNVILSGTFYSDLLQRVSRVIASHTEGAGDNQVLEHWRSGGGAKLWQRLDAIAAAAVASGAGRQVPEDTTAVR